MTLPDEYFSEQSKHFDLKDKQIKELQKENERLREALLNCKYYHERLSEEKIYNVTLDKIILEALNKKEG